MRIAIVGAGISGLTAAHQLHRQHDVHVFEANDYAGGHTNTVDVELDGQHHAVDTGFIVFNERTYPNFISLLAELGVASQPSPMSFSVKCERTGLEYNGTSRNALFAQRRNLVSPKFLGMIRDILRFHREAPSILRSGDTGLTLGQYLRENAYSRQFIDHYIIPMGAAIWSSGPGAMEDFPARHFIAFFSNHGLLQLRDRPRWFVIQGGSRQYVNKLIEPFADRVHLRSPVRNVRRTRNGVYLTMASGESRHFDALFLACHSDQALAMLSDPSPLERDVLGAIKYEYNQAILHTDHRILPRRRLAWAAWNYHIPKHDRNRVALTYNMNILQSLKASRQLCVTLNYGEHIDPAKVIRKIDYHHPVFTAESLAAQRRHVELNGANQTYYCGAYWRNGFHEDGVVSALNAVDAFRRSESNEQLHLQRAS